MMPRRRGVAAPPAGSAASDSARGCLGPLAADEVDGRVERRCSRRGATGALVVGVNIGSGSCVGLAQAGRQRQAVHRRRSAGTPSSAEPAR